MTSNGRGRPVRRLILVEIIVAVAALCIGITISRVVADRGYVFGSGIWSSVSILITWITALCSACYGTNMLCALASSIIVAFIALIEVSLSLVFTVLMNGCRECKSASIGGSLYLALSLIMIFEFILAIVTSVACCCGCCCCDESIEEPPSVRLPIRYQTPVRNQALFDRVLNNELNNGHSQENITLSPSRRFQTQYQTPVRNQALFDRVLNNELNNGHSQENITLSPSRRLQTQYQTPVRNQALFDRVMNNGLNNNHTQEGNDRLQLSAPYLDVNPSAPHFDVNPSAPDLDVNPQAPPLEVNPSAPLLVTSDPMLEDRRISVDDSLPVYDDLSLPPAYNELSPPPAYNELFPTHNR